MLSGKKLLATLVAAIAAAAMIAPGVATAASPVYRFEVEPSTTQAAGHPTFDWRELERWNIPESRLPDGSVVLYRGPTLWQEHRGAVIGAAGLLALQSLLIAALVYQRRARERAEL